MILNVYQHVTNDGRPREKGKTTHKKVGRKEPTADASLSSLADTKRTKHHSLKKSEKKQRKYSSFTPIDKTSAGQLKRWPTFLHIKRLMEKLMMSWLFSILSLFGRMNCNGLGALFFFHFSFSTRPIIYSIHLDLIVIRARPHHIAKDSFLSFFWNQYFGLQLYCIIHRYTHTHAM